MKTIHKLPSGQRVAMIGSLPPNKLGYFATPGQQLSPEVALIIINGPLTAMQEKLTAELAKPEVEGL
ncbi:MAG: hypothetical protein AAB447_03250 [Patescibacteria group bacterium]